MRKEEQETYQKQAKILYSYSIRTELSVNPTLFLIERDESMQIAQAGVAERKIPGGDRRTGRAKKNEDETAKTTKIL